MSTNQSAGNPKTFPIVENRGYANEQPNAMVIHTIDLITVIVFMHPYLIELICGSDTNMMLNHFCVFLYPNTPNLTRHKFFYLSVCLFLKENEIIFNIPNFCPPVYNAHTEPIYKYLNFLQKNLSFLFSTS